MDCLADAYVKIGVREGDTIGICTINMLIVQENLLACSKIGAISKWIDLRIKGKDLIKNINESNCSRLREMFDREMAEFHRPVYYEFLKELPLTAAGKVDYRKLEIMHEEKKLGYT